MYEQVAEKMEIRMWRGNRPRRLYSSLKDFGNTGNDALKSDVLQDIVRYGKEKEYVQSE